MYPSDIAMGFVDLVPVGLFLAAAIIFQRMLYNKMSKGAFALYSAGTITVFVAGLLKAIYKILLTLRIGSWSALSACFFPMQTVGFVLAGAGLAAAMLYKQGANVAACMAAPFIVTLAYADPNAYKDVAEFNGTMVFVVFMCLGVAVMNLGLGVVAHKMKKDWIIAFIVVAFICTLGMGYLSTKDEMNDWIKEFVNSLGQLSLLLSAIFLKKAGLGESHVSISLLK